MSERLTKNSISEILASENLGMNKSQVDRFLDAFSSYAVRSIEKKQSVRLAGLGIFKIVLVRERESVHIKTGERFVIPAHHKLSFNPDKNFKENINRPYSFLPPTLKEEPAAPQESQEAQKVQETGIVPNYFIAEAIGGSLAYFDEDEAPTPESGQVDTQIPDPIFPASEVESMEVEETRQPYILNDEQGTDDFLASGDGGIENNILLPDTELNEDEEDGDDDIDDYDFQNAISPETDEINQTEERQEESVESAISQKNDVSQEDDAIEIEPVSTSVEFIPDAIPHIDTTLVDPSGSKVANMETPENDKFAIPEKMLFPTVHHAETHESATCQPVGEKAAAQDNVPEFDHTKENQEELIGDDLMAAVEKTPHPESDIRIMNEKESDTAEQIIPPPIPVDPLYQEMEGNTVEQVMEQEEMKNFEETVTNPKGMEIAEQENEKTVVQHHVQRKEFVKGKGFRYPSYRQAASHHARVSPSTAKNDDKKFWWYAISIPLAVVLGICLATLLFLHYSQPESLRNKTTFVDSKNKTGQVLEMDQTGKDGQFESENTIVGNDESESQREQKMYADELLGFGSSEGENTEENEQVETINWLSPEVTDSSSSKTTQNSTKTSSSKPTTSKPQKTAAPPAPKEKTIPASIKMPKGSTLRELALEYYGDKVFWVYIYEYNKTRISNPDQVPEGLELRLPPKKRYGINAKNKESLQKAHQKQGEYTSPLK